jgi:hypothetical protein
MRDSGSRLGVDFMQASCSGADRLHACGLGVGGGFRVVSEQLSKVVQCLEGPAEILDKKTQ